MGTYTTNGWCHGVPCTAWMHMGSVLLRLYPEYEALRSWDRKGGIRFPIVSCRILCFKKSLELRIKSEPNIKE